MNVKTDKHRTLETVAAARAHLTIDEVAAELGLRGERVAQALGDLVADGAVEHAAKRDRGQTYRPTDAGRVTLAQWQARYSGTAYVKAAGLVDDDGGRIIA